MVRIWWGKKERDGTRGLSLPTQVIPSLDEMAGEISRGLANNLHSNIVPGHSGSPTSVVHFLVWFIELEEVKHSRV